MLAVTNASLDKPFYISLILAVMSTNWKPILQNTNTNIKNRKFWLLKKPFNDNIVAFIL